MNHAVKAGPGVSLCTYTYNDPGLLAGLLDSLAGWSVRPAEVIVVDDASRVPWVVEERHGFVRLIRHEVNRGCTGGKKTAFAAARSEVLLSIDCDMRLSPGWLAAGLAEVVRPEVGAVTSPILTDAGNDLVSRYMRVFSSHLEQKGSVEFVSGNVWLFRKEVWERIGGFGDYEQKTKQDHVFSRRLRAAGYTLWAMPGERAVQARRVSRAAAVRRHWVWLRPAETTIIEEKGTFFLGVYSFLYKAVERIEHSLAIGEPLFVYLELLYAAHALLDLSAWAEAQGIGPREPAAGFWTAFSGLAAGFPALLAQLVRDLADLGQIPPTAATEDGAAEWADYLSVLEPLRAACLPLIERDGVRILRAEDAGLRYDFSFYREM